MVFAGDFRQTLPIIRGCSDEQIAKVVASKAPVYEHARKYALSENMRITLRTVEIQNQLNAAAGSDLADDLRVAQKARRDLARQTKFTSDLRDVGDGKTPAADLASEFHLPSTYIDLNKIGVSDDVQEDQEGKEGKEVKEGANMGGRVAPDSIVLRSEECPTGGRPSDREMVKDLVDFVYPELRSVHANLEPGDVVQDKDLPLRRAKTISDSLLGRAVLTPLNVTTHAINERCLEVMGGLPATSYYSGDSTVEQQAGEKLKFPPSIEELNAITPSGFPLHRLDIKTGCLIIIVHNLNEMLTNGTRCVVINHSPLRLFVKVMTENKFKDKTAWVPRIAMKEEILNQGNCYHLRRIQFPCRLGYALTINKAQGQSLKLAGVFLPTSCFSHGQLYVALSRVGSPDAIRVLLTHDHPYARESDYSATANIVRPDVLLSGDAGTVEP